jgi:hypothetical protein
MPTIAVELSADRTQLGTLSLLADDGTLVARPFQVHGKADGQTAANIGNAARNPRYTLF